MKEEGLEERRKHRVRALLALGEVAAVDDAYLHHDPHEHQHHPDDPAQDALDQVHNQQQAREPRPRHGMGQIAAVLEQHPIAELGERLRDDEPEGYVEEDADWRIQVDGQDGAQRHSAREYAEDREKDVSEDIILRERRRHHLPRKQAAINLPVDNNRMPDQLLQLL